MAGTVTTVENTEMKKVGGALKASENGVQGWEWQQRGQLQEPGESGHHGSSVSSPHLAFEVFHS